MTAVTLMASIVHCYVGCNSGSPDLQALHVLECDTETGAAKIVQSVKGIQGTTYFQFDRGGRYLYSAIGEKRGEKQVGSIVRFPTDGWRLGAMERICDLPCEAPCHVALTPDERRVAFAAYLSGTAGTVGTDGKGLKTYVFPSDAMGPNKKRQQKAYAHQAFFIQPSTSNLQPVLGICDLGCDRIRFFDPETMARAATGDLRFEAGDGPRHALLSRDGRHLFVLNELSSTVTSFEIKPSAVQPSTSNLRSQPSVIGRYSMLPAAFDRWCADGETLATKAAAIKLTADGKTLMASNRGHDSIAFFAVGEDGRLTLRNVAKLKGKFPRDFELMPGERFMVVGHKMSDEIQVYRFDRGNCALEPVGEPIACYHPLCFKFKPTDYQTTH